MNKKEQLRKEVECIAEKRQVVFGLLKNEHVSLKLEKKTVQDQHKQDIESLNHKREYFMNKIEQKHSKWFKRIQKVHANILLGIEMQKREFESNID